MLRVQGLNLKSVSGFAPDKHHTKMSTAFFVEGHFSKG